jgi:hypothetical protein
VDDETGKANAFNAAGRSLGVFPGYDSARNAAAAEATAQALDLNRPSDSIDNQGDHRDGGPL